MMHVQFLFIFFCFVLIRFLKLQNLMIDSRVLLFPVYRLELISTLAILASQTVALNDVIGGG